MTEYADGLAASAAVASAMAAAGLANEDGRLIGNDAVHAEAIANILNGEIPIGTQLTPGAGALGAGGFYETSVERKGGLIITRILIDLTGLASAAAADILGLAAGGAAHIGQITTAINGLQLAGFVQCLETPAVGEPDIDLYSATVATGAFDDAISGLVETAIVDAAADWTGVMAPKSMTTVVPPNGYLYLVSSGGGDVGTYTAGKFLITLFGQA